MQFFGQRWSVHSLFIQWLYRASNSLKLSYIYKHHRTSKYYILFSSSTDSSQGFEALWLHNVTFQVEAMAIRIPLQMNSTHRPRYFHPSFQQQNISRVCLRSDHMGKKKKKFQLPNVGVNYVKQSLIFRSKGGRKKHYFWSCRLLGRFFLLSLSTLVIRFLHTSSWLFLFLREAGCHGQCRVFILSWFQLGQSCFLLHSGWYDAMFWPWEKKKIVDNTEIF